MTNSDIDIGDALKPEALTTGRSVFLAFQGGGARGIAHVGGLSAVNNLNLTISGVAGTSAGAIMAALVAAHYRADALFNPEARTHLLQSVANGRYQRATALFGKDWSAIRTLRRAAGIGKAIAGWVKTSGLDLIWSQVWSQRKGKAAVVGAGLVLALMVVWHVPRPALAILLALLAGLGWVAIRCLKGLASLREVRELVDVAIAEGLNIRSREITFEQMMEHGGLPLKLVATNVSGKSLELFSVETTPTAVVADAVAASICLPIVFQPWTFAFARRGQDEKVEQQFIDGGLVSNLPAWTFDEDRALQPDTVTVAFGLQPPPSAEDAKPNWFTAALQTVVAGPPEVHFRGIDRMVHVPLESAITVLDFDADLDTLGKDVEKARSDATLQIKLHVTAVPEAVRQVLADLQEQVGGALREAFSLEASGVDEPLFRIALAIQKPTDRKSLAIAYEVGHPVSQRGVRFGLAASDVGAAWQGNPRVSRESDEQVYKDAVWTGYVPVYDREPLENDDGSLAPAPGEAAVVAVFDSARPLPARIWDDRDEFEDFWLQLSEAASEFLAQPDVGQYFRRSAAWV